MSSLVRSREPPKSSSAMPACAARATRLTSSRQRDPAPMAPNLASFVSCQKNLLAAPSEKPVQFDEVQAGVLGIVLRDAIVIPHSGAQLQELYRRQFINHAPARL